jgi:hypothetical protein
MTYKNWSMSFLMDPDSDGKPNWWDTDSDGDLLPDSEEGHVQTNAAGLPLFLDPQIMTSDNLVGDSSPSLCVSRCPDSRPEIPAPNSFDQDSDGMIFSAVLILQCSCRVCVCV